MYFLKSKEKLSLVSYHPPHHRTSQKLSSKCCDVIKTIEQKQKKEDEKKNQNKDKTNSQKKERTIKKGGRTLFQLLAKDSESANPP